MKGFRLAGRLARREVRRRPGRTFLVALLVAFPVATMVMATVLVRTEHLAPMQRWRTNFGQADALSVRAGGPIVARSHVVQYRTGFSLLRSVGGDRVFATVTDLPLADPITDGMVQVTSGRAPKATNEVFLTRETARDLGVGLGDELRLRRPATRTYRVVGVGEMASSWDQREMIVGPGARFPWGSAEDGGRQVLVQFPPGTRHTDVRGVDGLS